jgi:hypothetical protein
VGKRQCALGKMAVKMERKKYIICAPLYSGSAGVRVLYMLRDILEEKGFDAKIFCLSKNTQTDLSVFTKKITNDNRKNDIVVYPEIVAGNPLRIRNVARLILFYPGRNGGMRRYHKSEMLFTYHPEFMPDADILTIPWIDESLFNNPGYERTQDCCFVYKGGRWKDVKELNNLPTITMRWPESREKLADLLKHTKTLYSFDNASAVLEEALLCGANVMLVTAEGYMPYKSRYKYESEKFPEQLKNFITKTQTNDYKGRIQSRYLLLYWAYAVWRYWIKPLFKTKKY